MYTNKNYLLIMIQLNQSMKKKNPPFLFSIISPQCILLFHSLISIQTTQILTPACRNQCWCLSAASQLCQHSVAAGPSPPSDAAPPQAVGVSLPLWTWAPWCGSSLDPAQSWHALVTARYAATACHPPLGQSGCSPSTDPVRGRSRWKQSLWTLMCACWTVPNRANIQFSSKTLYWGNAWCNV